LKVQWLDQTWTMRAARADPRAEGRTIRPRLSEWFDCAAERGADGAESAQYRDAHHGCERRPYLKLTKLFDCAAERGADGAARRPYLSKGARWKQPRLLGFTVLEMLVVITIIGFLAAMALPHLAGMSKANVMTTATQQMLGDVALARQMAMSHRTTVYMVFVSTNAFSGNGAPTNDLSAYTNLMSHQFSAYALFSPRSVGDQPGRSIPQYLTRWKTLPDGVFFPVFMFSTNQSAIAVYSTNTLSNQRNFFPVSPFATLNQVPFPGVEAYLAGSPFGVSMPCIGFSPLGQLTVNNDLYIPLARGTVVNLPGGVVFANESPAWNSTNNCNLVHIDWLTARAKIEHNQF